MFLITLLATATFFSTSISSYEPVGTEGVTFGETTINKKAGNETATQYLARYARAVSRILPGEESEKIVDQTIHYLVMGVNFNKNSGKSEIASLIDSIRKVSPHFHRVTSAVYEKNFKNKMDKYNYSTNYENINKYFAESNVDRSIYEKGSNLAKDYKDFYNKKLYEHVEIIKQIIKEEEEKSIKDEKIFKIVIKNNININKKDFLKFHRSYKREKALGTTNKNIFTFIEEKIKEREERRKKIKEARKKKKGDDNKKTQTNNTKNLNMLDFNNYKDTEEGESYDGSFKDWKNDKILYEKYKKLNNDKTGNTTEDVFTHEDTFSFEDPIEELSFEEFSEKLFDYENKMEDEGKYNNDVDDDTFIKNFIEYIKDQKN